jgi:hypothetical protein|tara:strand:+ start:5853 stop:6038 length:186 start_codon:yes stop_codon:yes gene_type:complete
MTDILTYFNDNKEGFLGILTAVVAAASAICALTPTPKDDTIVRKVYVLVEWLALNVGKAKD